MYSASHIEICDFLADEVKRIAFKHGIRITVFRFFKANIF